MLGRCSNRHIGDTTVIAPRSLYKPIYSSTVFQVGGGQRHPTSRTSRQDLAHRRGRTARQPNMPDDEGNGSRSRAPTVTIKHRQRDPELFTGNAESDVEDWLKSYERVSQHNGWDDCFKLANVVIFLKDTAFRWYDNHEEVINSWDGFKTSFADAFGQPEHRKQRAQDQLLHRYQSTAESSTAYIEDVLRLSHRVDPQMSENDKIRHLFKGLSQEHFSIVAPRSPKTVANLVSECRKHEELDNARILKRPFERLPEVSAGLHIDTSLSARYGPSSVKSCVSFWASSAQRRPFCNHPVKLMTSRPLSATNSVLS